MWNKERIHAAVEAQRAFFLSGATLPVEWRLKQLEALKRAVLRRQSELEEALGADLGRSPAEADFCDVGALIMELNEALRGLKGWARPERRFPGLRCFPAMSYELRRMPYGVTLIISPFNFPIYLSLAVLTASLAAGNTAVLKTSAKSARCTEVLSRLIRDTFPPEAVTLVDGGHETAELCLGERFDKIFYTGSPRVGRHIMEAAAKNLTPVALELGGETGNWCVVRKDADLRDAARKIAFFKLLNSGQICIDINQVAVAEEVAEDFLRELKAAYEKQIGPDALSNPEYPRLIDRAAYERCAADAEANRSRVVYGGYGDAAGLRYAPTLLYPVGFDEDLVKREHFNPLLPVAPFPDAEADALMDAIARREHGLALYLFTKDLAWARRVMAAQQFGGGCINEVCLHMMAKGAPFGGAGHSGMGAYHGKWGFLEFTHPCTVLIGSNRLNLPLREHPYKAWKRALVSLVER